MTTTNRERREAVARAIRRSDNGDVDDWAEIPEVCRDDYRVNADAAIAAMLPDRAAFDDAITELAACAMEWGVHESQGRITADEQERLTNEAADAVRALVYGDDDAQAGDQEGAEHE